MKKLVVVLVVVVLLFALSAPAFAFPNGAVGVPAAHGADGKTFGGLVSAGARGEITDFNLAEHARGVADHVRGK